MRIVFIILLFLIPQTIGNFLSIDMVNNVFTKEIKNVWKEKVTMTIYTPTNSETDSTPDLTASGFKIDTDNPSKHKIIAVSRDLKRKGWGFNKKVRIRKAGKYNGVYTIKDLMNKRYKKTIDILVDEDHKPVKLKNVEITLLK